MNQNIRSVSILPHPRRNSSAWSVAQEGSPEIACETEYERRTLHLRLNVHELFMQQNRPGLYQHASSYNRLDIVVRYLAIEHHLGLNNDGFGLYARMQAARMHTGNAAAYISRFRALIDSCIHTGLRTDSEIELDAALMLMDGSHRLALALYLGDNTISVKVRPVITRIRYSVDWFAAHSFRSQELRRILDKYHELAARGLEGISCILWPPVYRYFDEITALLGEMHVVQQVKDRECSGETLAHMVRAVYACDDIEAWKVDKKLQAMSAYPPRLRYLELYLPLPGFRLKVRSHRTLSTCGEQIKAWVRGAYKARVVNYFHDIIIHTADNYDQSRCIASLFEPGFDLHACFRSLTSYRYMILKHEAPYINADFPDSFPFGKDLDLICAPEETAAVVEEMEMYLRQVCCPTLELRRLTVPTGQHLRIEAIVGGGDALSITSTSAVHSQGLRYRTWPRHWNAGRRTMTITCRIQRTSLFSGHARWLNNRPRATMLNTSELIAKLGMRRRHAMRCSRSSGSGYPLISGIKSGQAQSSVDGQDART